MSKHILVVDDDPEILEITTNILQKNGFGVSTATNGLIALEEIKKQRPDLILADVLMPEMDGYAFYKELKNDSLMADIPVLIVTGRGKMEDSFKVMGVDGFITKPFSPKSLVEEINHICDIAFHREIVIAQEGKDGSSRKIFAISPDKFILDDMAHQAMRAGYKIEVSQTGASALSQCIKFNPNIFFIDIQIEDIGVKDLMTTLRALPQFKNTPIIGFCYYATEDLGKTKVRQRILMNKDLSNQIMAAGATQYMGRYSHQLFTKTFIAYLNQV